MTPQLRERLVGLLRAGRTTEYPWKPGHVFAGPQDLKPARETNPLFYGCFDWHSAVHTHWALARLDPGALIGVFTPQAVAAEVDFLRRHPSFEVPYGMAWLVLLCEEYGGLEPLRTLAVERLAGWLERLPGPIRSGEHAQSAFAMGMAHDYAPELRDLVRRRGLEWYLRDRDGPLRYEPSAYDFLSPCLAEADLMRRLLLVAEWEEWLHGFLPRIELEPVVTADRSEGKLAHFDGLNLSRAWMLRNMGMTLDDPRLLSMAEAHAAEGLKGLWSDRYEVTHWLGSFAVYWLTETGL